MPTYALIFGSLLVVSDILAFQFSIFAYLSEVLWLIGTLAMIGLSGLLCFRALRGTSLKAALLVGLPLTLWVLLLCWYAIQPWSINSEATLQIACGLATILSDTLGHASTCFLGQPARGFIFPALPSLILGRTQFAHNLGGMSYYILGTVLLCSAALALFKNDWRGAALGYFSIIFPLTFYFLSFELLAFEQSNHPCALGAAALGAALMYAAWRDKHSLALLFILSLHLVHTYPPAMTLVGLVLIAGTVGILYKKLPISVSAALLIMMLELAFSLTYRADMPLARDTTSLTQHLQDLWSSGSAFLLGSEEIRVIGICGTALCIVLLAWAVTKLRGGWILAAWICAAVVSAVWAQGYTHYEIPLRLHRTLVIVPALILLFAIWLSKIRSKHTPERLSVALLLVLLTCDAACTHWGIVSRKARFENMMAHPNYINSRYLNLIKDMRATIDSKVLNAATILALTGDARENFISLFDQLQYFQPALRTITVSDACEIPAEATLAIVDSKDTCRAELESNGFINPTKIVFREDPVHTYMIRN